MCRPYISPRNRQTGTVCPGHSITVTQNRPQPAELRSDPDPSAEDVALGYKNLLEAERGFRDLKSTFDLRPVFHRVEPRIRAHVLLCWLALLLIRVAERRTGLTWRRIAIELGRVYAVTLTSTAGTVVQTTPTQRSPTRHCWLYALKAGGVS